MPGLHGAPNVHPFFVHFPIVLWVAAFGFAFCGAMRNRDDLTRVGRWLLYVGTLTGLVAAATGWQAMQQMSDMPGHFLIHIHMYWMFTAAGLAAATCVLAWLLAGRAVPWARWTLTLCLAVTCGVMTIGADRGALLVFRYAIGTQGETPPEDPEGHGAMGHRGSGHESEDKGKDAGSSEGHGGHK